MYHSSKILDGAPSAYHGSIPTRQITVSERQLIEAITAPATDAFATARAHEQRWIAQAVNHQLAANIPWLPPFLRQTLDSEPIVRVTGLPTSAGLVPLLTAALSQMNGEIFNYSTQNDGALVQMIKASPDAPDNSNASPKAFGWHNDDSAVLAGLRTQFIALYGRLNDAHVTTGFALLSDLLAAASAHGLVIDQFYRNAFSKRVPRSFGIDDRWVHNLPLIELSDLSTPAIAWPTYATYVTDPNDLDAAEGLRQLEALIPLVARNIAINPGHFVIWDNDQLMHSRGAIGNAARELHRCYVRRDLDALCRATEVSGPIFDLHRVLAA